MGLSVALTAPRRENQMNMMRVYAPCLFLGERREVGGGVIGTVALHASVLKILGADSLLYIRRRDVY